MNRIIINKNIIHKLMNKNNIKTQNDLAKQMGITKSELSLILSNKFSPIKNNVNKLVNVLGIGVLDAIVPQSNTKKYQQESLLGNASNKENKQFPNSEIDVSNVKPKHTYTDLELFAGAGGLALALEEAGFKNVGNVEIDEKACETLKANRPQWNIIHGDIKKINANPEGIYKYIGKDTDVDLLSGGYPCQSFSYAGKHLGLKDTRGTLFNEYAKVMKQVRPKMFVVENVKGLITNDHGKTLKTMIHVFKGLGYNITYKVLNAWNYGVAEKRKRMILIGIRNDLDITYQYPKPFTYKPVLRDILPGTPKSPGAKYPESKKKVLDLVKPGGCWRDLPKAVAKKYMGKSYYSGGGKTGVARRLSWDEPSLTLTTAPNQKRTERCYPDATRPLTTREYARIQSFPDSWKFKGGITSIYKQIGNAVAVNFGKQIGLSIVHSLNQLYK